MSGSWIQLPFLFTAPFTMKKILLFTNGYIEWTCRLLFTINIVIQNLYDQDHSYPVVEYFYLLIALWLYFFKLKPVSILFLLFTLYLNYMHITIERIY